MPGKNPHNLGKDFGWVVKKAQSGHDLKDDDLNMFFIQKYRNLTAPLHIREGHKI